MKRRSIWLLLPLLLGIRVKAQTKVVLDNYFNHEINASGNLFHYLWSDRGNSGFSQWGDIFKEKGAILETLQQAPRDKNLNNANIYIIVDPDTKAETPAPHYIRKKDIKAITHWVRRGGILVLMANDSGNSEFTHLNRLAKKFGMHFNEVSLNHVAGQQWEMGAITRLPDHPIFAGVQKIYIKEASSLNLTAPAKPVLTKEGHVFMALSPVGGGYVFAVTDPWIYNEYIGNKYLPGDFQNHQAAENLADYLIGLTTESR